MKKRTRLSLFLLALVMSAVAAPEAFGLAKGKGGRLIPHSGTTQVQGYQIDCGNGGPLIPCSGSYDYCVGYCDGKCGGGPGSCA
jgi:hypothetical protein